MTIVHPLEPILELYIKNIDLRPHTLKDYSYALKMYIQYLKTRNIIYANRSDLIAYKKYLMKIDKTARTVQKFIAILKGFYRWIRLNRREYGFDEIYEFDISEGIKNINSTRSYAKDGLTAEEAKLLIEVAYRHTESVKGLRNYCIILLMITTGLRIIEISRAKRTNLRKLKGCDILYVHGKSREFEDEFVKISEPVMRILNEYLFYRMDKNSFLFIKHRGVSDVDQLSTSAIRDNIGNLMEEAGLKSSHISPHSLRHTCAILSLETGNSIHDTQMLLRHTSMSSTLIYVHQASRINSKIADRITNYLEIREEKNKYAK